MIGWAYYKTITVSDDNVNADLADFPLLVAFDADPDIGAHARTDGYDLRFTTGDGQAELPFERESFSVTDGQASGRFWVRVPQLVASGGGTAATIRCYYGNPSANDASDPTNVWTSNFGCVFHFRGGDPSSEYDSVDPTRQLTPVNSPVWHSDGPQGAACYEFSRSAKKSFYTSGWTPATGSPLTLEAFIEATSGDISAWLTFLTLRETSDYHALGTASANRLRAMSYTPGSGSPAAYATVNADQWYHMAGTFTGTNQREIWIDGQQIASNTTDVGAMDPATQLIIGDRAVGGGYGIDGRLAEVRVSTVVRSAAWLRFTWANLSSNDHELTWGAQTPTGVIEASVLARSRYQAVLRAHLRHIALVRAGSGL